MRWLASADRAAGLLIPTAIAEITATPRARQSPTLTMNAEKRQHQAACDLGLRRRSAARHARKEASSVQPTLGLSFSADKPSERRSDESPPPQLRLVLCVIGLTSRSLEPRSIKAHRQRHNRPRRCDLLIPACRSVWLLRRLCCGDEEFGGTFEVDGPDEHPDAAQRRTVHRLSAESMMRRNQRTRYRRSREGRKTTAYDTR